MLLWYIETDLFCIEGVIVKRFFTLVCLVLCAFTLAVISFAHPGGTDGSGGHYNHDTGEYHYHHGYPEHQHPDGVCPYNLQENDITTTTKPTEFPLYSGRDYIDTENSEDVLESDGEDKLTLEKAIDFAKKTGKILTVLFVYYGSFGVIGFLNDKRKEKKRSRN